MKPTKTHRSVGNTNAHTNNTPASVTISRKLAEYFAADMLNAMDALKSIPVHMPTFGYLKCLMDNEGGEYESPAIEYATIYREIMGALGKADDLPEPRAFVRKLKKGGVL